MTLSERYEKMNHLPGDKEWIIIKHICERVDKHDEVMKLQGVSNQIISKMFELIRKEPMYGPMLEDDE